MQGGFIFFRNSIPTRLKRTLRFALLAALCACSASTPGGGGGPGGNFANAPVQPSGVAAADVNIFAGKFILVHDQVTPSGDGTLPGTVHIQLKGQLFEKGGTVFSSPTIGRTIRIYEPTLRQFVDRPMQDSSAFDATFDVLPTSFDAGTQKTKSWCFFAVPQGFGPTVDQPTACPLPAPDCFPLDKTWLDFLNENYIDDPCPLPIPVP